MLGPTGNKRKIQGAGWMNAAWAYLKKEALACLCVFVWVSEWDRKFDVGECLTRVKMLKPLWNKWPGFALKWYVLSCSQGRGGHWRGTSTRANCFLPAYCQRQSLFLKMGRHVWVDYGPWFRPTLLACPTQPIAPLYHPVLYTMLFDEMLMWNI